MSLATPLPGWSSRSELSEHAEATEETRRPRVAIMGEFSAGKSTLTNLLMGDQALPTRVTATQLPPVWLSHGEGSAYGETVEGVRFPIDPETLDRQSWVDPGQSGHTLDVAETRYLRVFRQAEILEACDLIDFPGISDPNMDADVWQRVLPLADAVLWCTHATQAWRQSEAAVWEEMSPELMARSLLLLTRIDRVVEARDRRRLITRVARETDGLFAGVYPVSLTGALAAGQDSAAWAASGAADLMDAFSAILVGSAPAASRLVSDGPEAAATEGPAKPVRLVSQRGADVSRDADNTVDAVHPTRIRPRRIRPAGAPTQRPLRNAEATAGTTSFDPAEL
ncbi:MAG: dynamin family protein [Pseudomonadota bacterium]